MSVYCCIFALVFLPWFSELAQAQCITCLQALMSWHSQLPGVDNVSRTRVSKIPQLFGLTEYGKKSYVHKLLE